MIPKTIFYAWFGPNPLPEDVKKNINNWKKLNPDFVVKRINEESFDINKYKFTKEAYDAKDWVFIVDVARLETIYKNGGFYLDTDVELIKPLSEFIDNKSVWALEDSDAINPGSMFGAQTRDDDISNILDIYKNKHYISGSDDMISVPIVSNYFLKKGFKVKNKKQYLSNKTLILPTDYFTPFHYWGGGHITKRTVGIHRFKGSWKDGTLKTSFRVKRQLVLLFPGLYYGVRRFREKLKQR
ncbi:glycosyltransferase family 32 protein [Limosilactobacillus reuteri]|uniref:glycosyltransferase family 32 protein n=1 Tax=Limosilactobacillus reuteri TaxID=1598 RepID=UPI00273F1B83|nr:glycosyltransferase [Limosilactobacillus reuteri]WLR79626.1 glycosyltransferase [Limosilactobacillus reuteri]